MDWQAHIEERPDILVGKPVIKGTRIAVEFLLDLLASDWSVAQILENYPVLKPDDVRAALLFAKEATRHERVFKRA